MEKSYLNDSPKVKSEKYGYVYITSTKRNLFCTLIDFSDKKVKLNYSYGTLKLSKTESVPAKLLGQLFITKLKSLKYNTIYIILTGIGYGRTLILNSFRNSDIKIVSIKETTRLPHNGCRPKKAKRKKLRTKISFKVRKLLSPGF